LSADGTGDGAAGPRPPSLAEVLALLTEGDGGMAVAELRALASSAQPPFSPQEMQYWLGLAHLLAFDWGGAAHAFRAYVGDQGTGWRAGWAFLHLGRAYEQAGRTDEASLAYRGCLAVPDAEKSARKFAFDRMSRLANSLPIGYGQAPTRPATD
jgi:hypothetical protein